VSDSSADAATSRHPSLRVAEAPSVAESESDKRSTGGRHLTREAEIPTDGYSADAEQHVDAARDEIGGGGAVQMRGRDPSIEDAGEGLRQPPGTQTSTGVTEVGVGENPPVSRLVKLSVAAAQRELWAASAKFDAAKQQLRGAGACCDETEGMRTVLRTRGNELRSAAYAYVKSCQQARDAARHTGDRRKTRATQKAYEQAVRTQTSLSQLVWDAAYGRY
jgi:hypothetical protein